MANEIKKEILTSSKAPKAVGPYSLGIRSGGFWRGSANKAGAFKYQECASGCRK